ncbi:MAG: MipA/OmpV family protein [Candidatus Thiodiazotropha endolucinida]|uniref:Outer membrane protein OmpV n=1 Tax=Candidatus Thiodiazotropha endolucinida TaxID=1655433 RepID=A0A7Z0VJI7_9GAMM|nr:MipA/OmpV family protein [Candidatus Thiodiazotropha endolucinida]MBT3014166.1 MipA/OmpV family protein [Candidatus Thiodiazotropha taylori]MBT3029534.1 MipA/OmpV family protein [Candidatus Thiodiazotropha sp. (ex Lucina pensylvanica)]MBT3051098.1 MipA/OmpV family protein [Candidatus Thiodiazotropha sp. (ex Codakia orbicularis)]ODJ86753.1 outer membrane protein OmpV precursor [Candidatus Thiodiazotropha endolucinida]
MTSGRNSRIIKITLSTLAAAVVMSLASQQISAGEWRVGANVAGGKNPFLGEDNDAILIPMIAYKGERFYANLGNPGISFFSGSTNFAGLGYSVIKEDDYNIDLVGRVRAMGLYPDDNDELEGVDDRDPGFDLGITARWQTGFGELNAQLLADVSDTSDGQEVILSYAYPLSYGQWRFRPELGVSWQSSDMTDYYFGVDADEATARRAVYEADAAVTPFAGVEFEYAFDQRIDLIGGVGVGRLGDEISDSPIVDERNLAGGYLGLSYKF